MTGGIVLGGWEFVYAAYGISFAVLLGYAGYTIHRLSTDETKAAAEDRR